MRKYPKKPSGYFWRVRKKAKELTHECGQIPVEFFNGRARQYVITIAFCDLPLINIKTN